MPYEEPLDSGARLGNDAVDHVGRCAGEYCDAECERIRLVNEARINMLQAEGRDLTGQAAKLEDRLREMPHPPGDLRARKRRAVFYWTIGILLILAAFAFTVIGFGPYRLGLIGILYCLGIAIVTPFAVDEFLKAWKHEAVLRAAIAVVFAAALIGGGLLAAVRGELLARRTEQTVPPVVIEGDATPAVESRPSFYDATEVPLKLLLLLFAFAIDLGGGIAIHRAQAEAAVNDKEYREAVDELATVRGRLAEIIFEMTALTNAPAIAEAEFWRDFYRAMLTQTVRRAVKKALQLLVLACFLWNSRGFAAERLNLVIALDLSKSEGMKSPDGTTPFGKNVAGIARLLASVPAESHVTVIAITEDSIRDPTPILTAEVSDDGGYFGERLQTARSQLAEAWRTHVARLRPSAPGTDIIGALFLAGEMFQNTPNTAKKMLVIFSDMRNATAGLNLEKPLPKPILATVNDLNAEGRVAALPGVAVHVSGANGGGRDINRWKILKEFWMVYFARAETQVESYSLFATPPPLKQ